MKDHQTEVSVCTCYYCRTARRQHAELEQEMVTTCSSCKHKSPQLFTFDPTIHTMMNEKQRQQYRREFRPLERPKLCPSCYAYYSHVEQDAESTIPGYLRARATSSSWR